MRHQLLRRRLGRLEASQPNSDVASPRSSFINAALWMTSDDDLDLLEEVATFQKAGAPFKCTAEQREAVERYEKAFADALAAQNGKGPATSGLSSN